jgi:hypothetical protein
MPWPEGGMNEWWSRVTALLLATCLSRSTALISPGHPYLEAPIRRSSEGERLAAERDRERSVGLAIV